MGLQLLVFYSYFLSDLYLHPYFFGVSQIMAQEIADVFGLSQVKTFQEEKHDTRVKNNWFQMWIFYFSLEVGCEFRSRNDVGNYNLVLILLSASMCLGNILWKSNYRTLTFSCPFSRVMPKQR